MSDAMWNTLGQWAILATLVSFLVNIVQWFRNRDTNAQLAHTQSDLKKIETLLQPITGRINILHQGSVKTALTVAQQRRKHITPRKWYDWRFSIGSGEDC